MQGVLYVQIVLLKGHLKGAARQLVWRLLLRRKNGLD